MSMNFQESLRHAVDIIGREAPRFVLFHLIFTLVVVAASAPVLMTATQFQSEYFAGGFASVIIGSQIIFAWIGYRVLKVANLAATMKPMGIVGGGGLAGLVSLTLASVVLERMKIATFVFAAIPLTVALMMLVYWTIAYLQSRNNK